MKNKILQIMYKLSKGEIKYNLATKQVLDLFAVVGQSEQLVCQNCKSLNIKKFKNHNDCQNCGWVW